MNKPEGNAQSTKEKRAIAALIDLSLQVAQEKLQVTEEEIARFEASMQQLSPEEIADLDVRVAKIRDRIARGEVDERAAEPIIDVVELVRRLREPKMIT